MIIVWPVFQRYRSLQIKTSKVYYPHAHVMNEFLTVSYKMFFENPWKSFYEKIIVLFNALLLVPFEDKSVNPRGDCERPCFDQLSAHILERLLFCWRSKMCACSWSKHGRLQSPLDIDFKSLKLVTYVPSKMGKDRLSNTA